MSLSNFVNKCGDWGLLPNNDTAKVHYANMKVMGPLMGNAGFSRMLKKLCMDVPDLSGVNSLGDLKNAGVKTRINVVVACHEILHYLHFLIDASSFNARSKKSVSGYDNEEELLTISGDKGTVGWPTAVEVACQPKLFNENSLCKILRLSVRGDHHSSLSDTSSGDTVDLSTIPSTVTSIADLWGCG